MLAIGTPGGDNQDQQIANVLLRDLARSSREGWLTMSRRTGIPVADLTSEERESRSEAGARPATRVPTMRSSCPARSIVPGERLLALRIEARETP